MTETAPKNEAVVDFDAISQLGAAVWTAQMFEGLFVLVARSALKCPDAKEFSDIAPFHQNAFKQPIGALVKELGQDRQIDRDLAERICSWVELRHTLVHRQVMPLIQLSNDAYWQSMKTLSKQLYVESAELCAELMDLFTAYASRMPEAQAWLDQNRDGFASFSKFGKEVRGQLGLPKSNGHG
jgi:hypothetical protein